MKIDIGQNPDIVYPHYCNMFVRVDIRQKYLGGKIYLRIQVPSVKYFCSEFKKKKDKRLEIFVRIQFQNI